MRKIPVTINHDYEHIVGWLEIDDTAVPDEMLSDMFVSWQYIPAEHKIVQMTLVPMMSTRRSDAQPKRGRLRRTDE